MTTSLDSYPVFPNWVFTGNLQLSPDVLENVLKELPTDLSKHNVAKTVKDKVNKDTLNLTKLMGAILYIVIKNCTHKFNKTYGCNFL